MKLITLLRHLILLEFLLYFRYARG